MPLKVCAGLIGGLVSSAAFADDFFGLELFEEAWLLDEDACFALFGALEEGTAAAEAEEFFAEFFFPFAGAGDISTEARLGRPDEGAFAAFLA